MHVCRAANRACSQVAGALSAEIRQAVYLLPVPDHQCTIIWPTTRGTPSSHLVSSLTFPWRVFLM